MSTVFSVHTVNCIQTLKVSSQPVLDAARKELYFGGSDGVLTCLTLPVGNGINPPTVRWTFNTGNVVGGIVSKPVIVDGIVYVGSYGHNNIHAVATDATGADGNGGTEVWSYSTGAVAVKADPVIYRGNLCVTSRLCLCAPPPLFSLDIRIPLVLRMR